ncbi:MAG: hypothetical protein A2504_09155 [Bdellovibrionales bacterium RIFOXYD12_FULL_39_22]|nr:MAG: hypothetical protein A2385_17395 [Bdellovibrionales bacterium RIFOXYB1_FULL_39_21]OFZ41091.1 MAG: hypothetical protein A2485_00320 [Bdellovibrionales bacterium RIFOXYC12_FULL_39_17]OFZ50304.1 MAG: hypothetical protein A2404_07635 [Bdellovibrionales bacterium RIFOXYC1_FULL_39_130]OFZ72057.1 MAG: hypothetical protein A2451_05580 [Bdellovibrionales bacterium RIFOXYC2_FULL_39_8]OFZ75105.1 MAG: hypothetical protein A2560_16330 [Bdellovibrionales bacterium RIFOXYD1_FULL_39_84]OFZ92253.1 MAG:
MSNSLGKKIVSTLFVSLLSLSVMAVDYDYSSKTVEELNAIRGTLRDATSEQRDAFRAEWQVRIAAMSAEDRAKYRGRPANAKMDGQGQKMKMKMKRQGKGSGNCDGSGRGRGK